jgi:hypothetical protein
MKSNTSPGSTKDFNAALEELNDGGVKLGDLALFLSIKERMDLCRAHCESPIEVQMLDALVYVGKKTCHDITIKCDNEVLLKDGAHYPDRLSILIQHEIGRFRVDFLVAKTVEVPDFDNQIPYLDGMMGPGTKIETHEILVECDGHDFHERTKEQARKDKKRDRELQKLGYKVFHFTGSEIFKNSVDCAFEVFDERREDHE